MSTAGAAGIRSAVAARARTVDDATSRACASGAEAA
jgi:hypothetical protein